MIVYATTNGVVVGLSANGSTVRLNNGKRVKTTNTNFAIGESVLVATNMETGKVRNLYSTYCTTPFPFDTKPKIKELPLYEEQ